MWFAHSQRYPGHLIFLHEGKLQLIGIYSVLLESASVCQTEVITSVSGKVIKMA